MKLSYSIILVPIDGSESSFVSVKYAIDLDRNFGSKLIALHTTLTWYRKEVQGWFDRISESCKKNKVALTIGVVSSHSLSASIAGSIAEYAESEDVDLIVIGTRGGPEIKRMTLGSVALNVVTYMHCPVLTVK
ncbi:MAG: universal stress protein [Nitrososphaeraceae archaeon]|jgi:nucleotide-binding universal stress UspA family protein